ncbi:hypothetical protein WAF17_22215 [Bernardetia sp. ABR2-2B]|uniref:hypothetical protein n=1 Tax=Bernardetia sp. ABR2-2B TaxID=3127472 RepID=UPI0030D6151D
MKYNRNINLLFAVLIIFLFSNCGNKTSETAEETQTTKTENKKETSTATGSVTVTGNGETYSGNSFDTENGLNSTMNWISIEDEAKVNITVFPTSPHRVQVGIDIYKLAKGNTQLSGSYVVSKSDKEKGQANISAKVFAENGEMIMMGLEEGTLEVSQVNEKGIIKLTGSGKGFFGVTPNPDKKDPAAEGKTLEELEASGYFERYMPKKDVPVSFSIDVQIPDDRVMIQNY